jgi:hypothetical protein
VIATTLAVLFVASFWKTNLSCYSDAQAITKPALEMSRIDATSEEAHRLLGIDPAYIELLRKAAEPGEGYPPKHGDRGVMFVAGSAFRYLLMALENAERVSKSVRNSDPEVRVAVFTHRKYISLMDLCGNETTLYHAAAANETNIPAPEATAACNLWHHVNDPFALEDLEIPPVKSDVGKQASPEFWMTCMVANTQAPYIRTLFLDNDAYVCPGFADLFLMADPMTENNLWTFPETRTADLVIGIDQYPYNANHQYYPSPGNLTILDDFQYFSDRNTGTYVLNFHRRELHTFTRFVVLVAQHIYNNVASKGQEITNDQVFFKLALYIFEKAYPNFAENTIPLHSSCRTYVGLEYAGTRGDLNGMYPIQKDTGKPCAKCSCTPCLVNHLAGTLSVEIDNPPNSTK